jgi:hypothetical protein
VHIEDARTFLTLSPEKYDLIVSVPSNPWVTGVSGLFSRDFFRVARERLAPGGRMVQWIHTYESNEGLVKLVVRTLRDSFEHGTTWLGAADMLLIASREEQVIDPGAMSRAFQRPLVAKDLQRLGITRVTTLLARQVHSDEGQLAFGGKGPVNTDDHNILEYLSPIAYFMAGEAVSLFDERLEGGGDLRFAAYSKTAPLNAGDWGEIFENLDHVHTDGDPLLRSVAERWAREAPGEYAPAIALARMQLAQDDFSAAVLTLSPVVNVESPSPEAVTLFLKAVAKLRERSTSVFHPPVEISLDRARALLEQNPNDLALREAIDSLHP